MMEQFAIIRKLFFVFGFILILGFTNALTLNQGIILNTTLSNSSINFSFNINLTNLSIESNYISLIGINFTNNTGTYTCEDVNYSTSNSILNSSEFNCSILAIVETAEESTTSEIAGTGGTPGHYPTISDLEKGYEKTVAKGWEIIFSVTDEDHLIIVNNVSNNSVNLTVRSDEKTVILFVNETRKLDLNNDGFYDLQIFLKSIKFYKANIILKTINEEISKEEPVISEAKEEKVSIITGRVIGGQTTITNSIKIIGSVFIIIIAIFLIVVILKKERILKV